MKNLSHVSTWTCVIAALMALSFWPSRVSAGELQNLLDKSKAFAAVPKVKHTPAFRLESFDARQYPKEAQGHQWWYICDGQERIGLLTTWFDGHVELFRFSPDVDKGAKYPIPEVYHWANLIGSRLPTNGSKFTFIKDAGDPLEFKTSNTEFRLVWDERLGYVLYGTATLPRPSRRRSSSATCSPGGIAESRDDHKRWQKTVRGLLPNGSISFVHHNPVNIPVDDVQTGGFVGFVTEEKMNPFVEVLGGQRSRLLCHVQRVVRPARPHEAPKAKEADGLYHCGRSTGSCRCPPPWRGNWKRMAVDRGPGKGESNLTGFLQNKVNDFETCVPHGKVYNGPIWQHINASEGPAHSGKKSIAVGGRGPGKVKCCIAHRRRPADLCRIEQTLPPGGVGEDQGPRGRRRLLAGGRRLLQLGRHQGHAQDGETQRRSRLDPAASGVHPFAARSVAELSSCASRARARPGSTIWN